MLVAVKIVYRDDMYLLSDSFKLADELLCRRGLARAGRARKGDDLKRPVLACPRYRGIEPLLKIGFTFADKALYLFGTAYILFAVLHNYLL